MTITSLSIAALGALGLAAPSFAWSATAPAGEYRVTATIAPAGGDAAPHLLDLSMASEGAEPVAAMTLRAWFVDQDGLILAPATLAETHAAGGALVASAQAMTLPARAVALMVVAQPSLRRAGADSAAAVVTRIPLPERGG